MEKGPNIPADSEGSTEKKDSKSKSTKKFAAPLPFAAEKPRETKPEVNEKEAPRPIIAESLLSKLTGEKEAPKDEAKATEKEPTEKTEEAHTEAYEATETAEAQSETETTETPEAFAETLEDQYVESMAEDLSEGQEISLREAEQVSESRDPEIIERALEHAEAAEAPLVAEHDAAVSNAEMEPAPEPTPEVPPPFILPEAAPDEEDTLPTPTAPPPRTSAAPPMPPVPPEVMHGAGLPPEPPESSPSSRSPAGGAASNPETSSAEVRRIAEDAAWSERQRGRREGVLAGMLLGGGIEHFRHKRREKKAEKQRQKAEQQQAKRVEKLEYDYAEARKAQVAEKSVRETQAVAQTAAERTAQQQIEKAEQDTAREKKAAEQARIEAQEAEQSAEELALPKDHHIEHSAWHAIEVDRQGRAVNQGAIEYGHEYYAERQHEAGPKVPVNEAAGEVALVAAAMDDERELPTVAAGAPSQQGASQPEGTTKTTRRTKSPLHVLTTPPATAAGTVGWLLVLIVLIVILVSVTR